MPDKLYYSYIRVSTLRQGQTGTSLDEQRDAIKRYAERNGLKISQEFEEKETAAKLGRPVFERMLNGLQIGKAQGVIIHKIDRSARNLKDWANLGELIDRGIEIHFANESLDLQSRGGRLSADIQAVVAADYIRNLREETKKGFYGRIKQGLYPRPAPPGYRDAGKGNPKVLDPVKAPLIRRAFELYSTGNWPLRALTQKLYDLGLKNNKGGRLTVNGLAIILHNPFYAGLIHIKVKGETFTGQHQPIVPKLLFEKVQDVFSGKHAEKRDKHMMLFKKLISCAECDRSLIAERQKGLVYYRCQNTSCPQKTVREDVIEAEFLELLYRLRFNEDENNYLRQQVKRYFHNHDEIKQAQQKSLRLQLDTMVSHVSSYL